MDVKRLFSLISSYLITKEEAFLLLLAVRTGLEPATPCVTGMYSNQLNYRTNFMS